MIIHPCYWMHLVCVTGQPYSLKWIDSESVFNVVYHVECLSQSLDLICFILKIYRHRERIRGIFYIIFSMQVYYTKTVLVVSICVNTNQFKIPETERQALQNFNPLFASVFQINQAWSWINFNTSQKVSPESGDSFSKTLAGYLF